MRRKPYELGDTCPHGHVLTADNLYEYARPCGKSYRIYRSCLTCKRERVRRCQTNLRQRQAEQRTDGERRQCVRCHQWRPLVHFTTKRSQPKQERRLCNICRDKSERDEAKRRRDEDGFLHRYLVGRIEAAHRRGCTYTEIAERVGTNRTSVVNWKNNKTMAHHRALVVFVERVRTDPWFDPPKDVIWKENAE